MNVLSASRPVVVDAVVDVSVVVLWLAVDVAVQWLVVAVVPAVESVLISLSWTAAVQSDLGDLVVVYVLSASGSSAPSPIVISRISFSAGDAIRTCAFRTLDRCCSL